MEDLKKLYSMRAKTLTIMNNYGKNLNDDQVYYIYNNTLVAESYNDIRFQGVFKVEGLELDSLYLLKNTWYRINGKKLAEMLKCKTVTINISNNGVIDIKGTKSMKIKPVKENSKKLYDFLNIVNKYNFEYDIEMVDIKDTLINSLYTTLPIVVGFNTDHGEIKNIRFVKKMIKTNYKETNILSAEGCLKHINEQVYINNIQIIKADGTKSKPLEIKITHLYGTVPF